MEYPTTPTTWLIEPGKEVGLTVISYGLKAYELRILQKVTHRHFQHGFPICFRSNDGSSLFG